MLFEFLFQDLRYESVGDAEITRMGGSPDVCIRSTEQHSFVEFAHVLCDVHYIVESRESPDFVLQVRRMRMLMRGEAVP